MKAAHSIIAKTALTIDQFLALQEQAKKEDRSMSAILRDSWWKSSDGMPTPKRPSSPKWGQFRAKSAPARGSRAQMHVRMNN